MMEIMRSGRGRGRGRGRGSRGWALAALALALVVGWGAPVLAYAQAPRPVVPDWLVVPPGEDARPVAPTAPVAPPAQGAAAQEPAAEPGLDPMLPPGPTMPLDVVQGERTSLLQRFVPEIIRLDRAGEAEIVGRISTYSFVNCQTGTAAVEWMFVHMDSGGLPAEILGQQGRCRMQVRWRSSGLNRVHMSYALFRPDNRITQRIYAAELPVDVAPAPVVDDGDELSPSPVVSLLLGALGGALAGGATEWASESGRFRRGVPTAVGAAVGALSTLTVRLAW